MTESIGYNTKRRLLRARIFSWWINGRLRDWLSAHPFWAHVDGLGSGHLEYLGTIGEIVMMVRGKGGRLRVQVENKYLLVTLEAATSQLDQCDEHHTAPIQFGK